MNYSRFAFPAVGIVFLCCGSLPAFAQLSSFAVLGGSTVTNTGATTVSGNLGVSPGSAVTGFPPGVVTNGTIHQADSVAAQAESDLTTLYNQLAGDACTTDLTGQNLGGLTLTPGVYCFTTSAQLTGTLTLNAQGNPNATFVFKVGSTFTTASGASVVMINNGSTCGVAWQVGSSATLGTGSTVVGTIVALSSITMNTGGGLAGRALARNGAVTLDTNRLTFCSGGNGLPGLPPPVLSTVNVPAMSLPMLAGLAMLLAGLGWFYVRNSQARG
ncbi:MAG: ice-binding family protein [Acidobacteriota bacterium]|nr:ice-binding family protein [Acidobacteriota bacterium]